MCQGVDLYKPNPYSLTPIPLKKHMENIETFLKQNETKELLRFSTAGSIDDGKSTLIGRLLHDSKVLYEDHIAQIKKSTTNESVGDLDYALFTDGLKAEREQGITIDVAYRYFSTPKRKFIIADTPGHEQYTRNMATGASTADLAVVLIDARNGVLPQTKRHTFISSLLGVPHMVVAINKMDLVGYSQERYDEIKNEFSDFANKLNINDLRFIPISALKGDNVVDGSTSMPWYRGESLMELLESIHIASDRNFIDLRFPVQYVLRPNLNFRGYCGQIISGVLKPGDEVAILPSMKTAKVKSIETYDGQLESAHSPMSVTVTLDDEIDISRGDMIVHRHNLPHAEKHFEAMIVWMGDQPLDRGKPYLLKMGAQVERIRFDKIRYGMDVNTLGRKEVESLSLNEIGRAVMTSTKPMFFDPYTKNRATGSFVIIDTLSNNTVGAGMLLDRESSEKLPSSVDIPPDAGARMIRRKSSIVCSEREKRLGHKPCTIWLTGLAFSGKTDIAYALEGKLFDLGCTGVVLDGENIRQGISKELDFSSTGRSEHLRRVAEIANILNDAGQMAICAFTSPIASERDEVKDIVGDHRFMEVHVNAPIEFCIERDDKGLYRDAKRGERRNVAGVDLDFEMSKEPDVVINSDEVSLDESVDRIISHLRNRGFFSKQV
jgi:bifunctional enzyme CysN/CysC